MMASFLTPFLPRYRRRHPGIEVQLIERSAARQSNQLARGETDVAMMRAGDARFAGRLLFPLYVLAVVPKAHRLARCAVVDIGDLADEPLLVLTTDFGTRGSFDAACESANVVPRVRFECSVAQTLIGLAGADHGIAIVASIAVMPDESLRAIPIVRRGAAIGHWEAVCWDPRRVMPGYVDAFVNELAAYARTTFPGRKLVRRAPGLPTPTVSAP